MRIYVGRWDLLPEDWEGINGLYEKTEDEIRAELSREVETDQGYYDNYLAIYTAMEFEETFNADNKRKLTGTDYWIKIFT